FHSLCCSSRDILSIFFCFFFFMLRPPLISTLFPYTTLFRSFSTSAGSMVLTRGSITISSGCIWLWFPTVIFTVYFPGRATGPRRSEEHTSELQSLRHLVCRLLLEKKKNKKKNTNKKDNHKSI